MGKKRKELSHEEIWDDSGLIDAWNESYEEYKLYHSIHARGQRVSDVLKAAEEVEEGQKDENANTTVDTPPVHPHTAQDEEVEHREVGGPTLDTTDQMDVSQPIPTDKEQIPDTQGAEAVSGLPTIPNTIIAQSSQDQGLKDLIMSWYWAGYYTGFYEGQRQTMQ